MTAALEGYEWLAARPAALYPRERPGTHFAGGWLCNGINAVEYSPDT